MRTEGLFEIGCKLGTWYHKRNFTIYLEEIFHFSNKKSRIYAAFGVSQTPNITTSINGENGLCQQDR